MRSLKDKKILITGGPTWVALDDVRIISNRSTGQLAQSFARTLTKAKAKVTLLEGPVVEPLREKGITVKRFCFYDELAELLRTELKRQYDIVIHAAAVSDYKPIKKIKGKISSKLKRLELTLAPTKKLINTIKDIAPKTFLVGFKLLPRIKNGHDVHKLFTRSQCDLVVINETSEKHYSAIIVDAEENILAKAKNRNDLVEKLTQILNK
jgi:phosphopantothenoylcysteine synthetase/decarboxylase